MSESQPKQTADEMTPALRRALVEIGAVIPTSIQEVKLAEAKNGPEPGSGEIEAAFDAVLYALDSTESTKPFIRLDESFSAASSNNLALAARNGNELDAKTLAQIESDVANALNKNRHN